MSITFLFLTAGFFSLHAQTNAAATSQQANPQVAREKALENNPALKKDGEDLARQGIALMSGSPDAKTPAQRQAFLEKMNSHRQKLRAAMLKEDPTLQPIFTKIDEHISEMKAKQLGGMQGSPSPSTSPTGH